MNDRMILLIALAIGLVLFLDELWMVAPEIGVGSPGWLIGDWTWAHVEPFGFDYHHWMGGIVLALVCIVLLRNPSYVQTIKKTWRRMT